MEILKYQTGPLSVNTYLVVDEPTKKGFLVDPGGQNSVIVNHLKEQGIHLEYLILTHAHGDHIGGLAYFQQETGAKIVVHKDDQPMLEDSKLNFSASIQRTPISHQADLLVTDGDHLQIGNMDLRFLHTPGHTRGGMCIYVNDALFSGDTLFASSIGRTDFPGSSYEQIRDSIHQKLFSLPGETVVYPGHMGSTTIGFEKENNPFV